MQISRHILAVNHSQGRFGHSPKEIIIHTMVGTVESAQSRFENPSQQVSAHYGVRSDGTITQWVSEGDTAWHAGDWNVNLDSIGIEHQDNGQYNAPRPDSLYAESAALVADICRRHNIACDRAHIKKHSEVHATGCPDALDIDRIVREAQAILNTHSTPQNPAPIPSNVSINSAAGTFTVEVPTLRVHKTPDSSDAGTFANTPDGMLHQGNTFNIAGWCVGSDPYGDGRNIWLVSSRGNYIWQGGTNAHFAPAPPPAAPEPTPAPAPAVVAVPEPAAAPESTPTPPAASDAPQATVEPTGSIGVGNTDKFVEAIVDTPIIDTVTGLQAQDKNGDGLFIPEGLQFRVTRSVVADGNAYYQTPNMVSHSSTNGIKMIDLKQIDDPTVEAAKQLAKLGVFDTFGAVILHGVLLGENMVKALFKRGGE